MLAIHAISQQAENARIALILAVLAALAYWRHLLSVLIRMLFIVLIGAAVVGTVVIAQNLHG